jgi:membrane protein YqaA with SNARE-associated domain
MPAVVIVLVIAGCVIGAAILAWFLGAFLGDQHIRPDFRLRHRRNRGERR